MHDDHKLIESLERAAATYDRVLAMDAKPDVLAITAGLAFTTHGHLFALCAAALRAGGSHE